MYSKTVVLLISPPFKGLLREPIGLYYLAGLLNSNGIPTSIMDFNIDRPTRRGFRRYIKDINPLIVGITSFTFNFSAAQDIIKEIKRAESEIVTVLGGVHASALPEDILNTTTGLDYIIIGEGEFSFLEFCRRIIEENNVEDVKGLAFRRGKYIVLNPPQELIQDIDVLPFPDRDLLSFEKYPLAVVQTSRGCPYSCIFCNINKFYGMKIRLREPKRVVDECSLLVERYGRERIFFFGDAFTFKPDWTEELCEEITRRGLKFSWGCETRVDNVTPSLLKKMKEAGCNEIQFGIDYGDEEVLHNLGKYTSIGVIEDAVRWAKEAGFFVDAFFIFNVPGEDEETMERTYNLIQRVPISAIEINLLTPYPGTTLWDDPERFGMKIVEKNFDYYTTKKYVMENIDFPRDKFVPAFKKILKRLNLHSPSKEEPEIFNFLKRDIKSLTWEQEDSWIRRIIRS
jgi:anaerobic magnesium-protoporphyrin IX monomethyl ester cyclase